MNPIEVIRDDHGGAIVRTVRDGMQYQMFIQPEHDLVLAPMHTPITGFHVLGMTLSPCTADDARFLAEMYLTAARVVDALTAELEAEAA